MYKRILAPLDGSKLSECTLPHITSIASGCRVPETILLRVVPSLSEETILALARAGGDLLHRAEFDNQAEARSYLAGVRSRLAGEGLAVEAVVSDGTPADQILEYARANDVDLIVMSSHGSTGISRFFFGSVAEKVLQQSPVPVLLVPPAGCRVEA